MPVSPSWPETLGQYLRATYGEPGAVERLGGLGQGQVYRVRCPLGSCIVKGAARSGEVSFYRTSAGVLAGHGVATPALHWSGQEAGEWWLILEDVPRALPRGRWEADPEVLAVLRRLHTSGIAPAPGSPAAYRPTWLAAMTETALSCLPKPSADRLAPLLRTMQESHQHLFAPWCAISGDPNPTNWGLREDGTLVLYDWERFCLGTPALDLAITIPGLGDATIFQRVASGYLRNAADSTPETTARLASDIAVAKVWSVAEFLNLHASGNLPRVAAVDWLVQRFPDWVRGIGERW